MPKAHRPIPPKTPVVQYFALGVCFLKFHITSAPLTLPEGEPQGGRLARDPGRAAAAPGGAGSQGGGCREGPEQSQQKPSTPRDPSELPQETLEPAWQARPHPCPEPLRPSLLPRLLWASQHHNVSCCCTRRRRALGAGSHTGIFQGPRRLSDCDV